MVDPCEDCIGLAFEQEPLAVQPSLDVENTLGNANQASQEDEPATQRPALGCPGEDQVAGGGESLSPTGPFAALAPLGPPDPLPSRQRWGRSWSILHPCQDCFGLAVQADL